MPPDISANPVPGEFDRPNRLREFELRQAELKRRSEELQQGLGRIERKADCAAEGAHIIAILDPVKREDAQGVALLGGLIRSLLNLDAHDSSGSRHSARH